MQGLCRHVERGRAGKWAVVLVGFTPRDAIGQEGKMGPDIGDRKL